MRYPVPGQPAREAIGEPFHNNKKQPHTDRARFRRAGSERQDQHEDERVHRPHIQAPADPPPRSAEVLDINAAAERKARLSATDNTLEVASGNGAAAALAQLAVIHNERRRASEFSMGNTGATLEDIVREMLRPMLQSWLEEKLAGLSNGWSRLSCHERWARLSRRIAEGKVLGGASLVCLLVQNRAALF